MPHWVSIRFSSAAQTLSSLRQSATGRACEFATVKKSLAKIWRIDRPLKRNSVGPGYLQRPPTRTGHGLAGGTAKGFGAELAAEIAWDCAAAAETSCALTLPLAALREPTECRGDAARSKAMAPSRNDIAESAMAACMASKNYVWAG
jgi:hypothetical protein